MTIRHTAFGDQHLDVAKSLDYLGLVRKRQGRFDEAQRLHREAIEISRAILGEAHPSIVQGLNNLASVASFSEDYATAASMPPVPSTIANV